jgi:hypothetical protein
MDVRTSAEGGPEHEPGNALRIAGPVGCGRGGAIVSREQVETLELKAVGDRGHIGDLRV